MREIYDAQLKTFRGTIRDLEQETLHQLEKSKRAIRLSKKAIRKIRQLVQQHDFASVEEEIHFFKHIKPEFIATFFYYTEVLNYEIKKQGQSGKASRKTAEKLLKNIDNFLLTHQTFYSYYQLNQTHFDDKYFKRLPEDVVVTTTEYYYQEEDFSTTHDILVAKFIAHHKLSAYLKNDLCSSGSENTASGLETERYKWGYAKTDLIELIYALQIALNLANIHLEVKALMASFESIFDIDLKNHRRIYMDIKTRKNPTQFLDHLKACLLQKIDEEHH